MLSVFRVVEGGEVTVTTIGESKGGVALVLGGIVCSGRVVLNAIGTVILEKRYRVGGGLPLVEDEDSGTIILVSSGVLKLCSMATVILEMESSVVAELALL